MLCKALSGSQGESLSVSLSATLSVMLGGCQVRPKPPCDAWRDCVTLAHAMPRPSMEPPCNECKHRARCAATGLTCRAFEAFVSGRSRSLWRSMTRYPSPKFTAHARLIAEREAAAEAAAELERERLARRRIRDRRWVNANRERVRENHRSSSRRARERKRAERIDGQRYLSPPP